MKNQLLVDTVRTSMSPRQKSAVSRIDAEDYQGVVRLARKELAKQGKTFTDEYCEKAIFALKQYYALTVFDPLNMHAVSDVLDPFWHAHILDTLQYKMLCEDIGAFMHHDPLDNHDSEKVVAIKSVYDYTYDTLAIIFGAENLDERFHPRIMVEAQMVCRHDIDAVHIPDDVFPVCAAMQPHKERYGHLAQRRQIASKLSSAA